MSQPSKEQWVEITEQMDSLYSSVFLRCDGYLLVTRMRRKKNKLEINTYINSFIKGEWFGSYETDDELSDIQRRFCRVSKRNLYTRKSISDSEKVFGKRESKKMGLYKKVFFVSPCWGSAKRLVSHLKKHNQNIEVLTHEEYTQAIEALPKEDAA